MDDEEKYRNTVSVIQEIITQLPPEYVHEVITHANSILVTQVLSNTPYQLTTIEKNYIKQGKIVNAIKEIRSRTKLGLKESKELADKYRDSL